MITDEEINKEGRDESGTIRHDWMQGAKWARKKMLERFKAKLEDPVVRDNLYKQDIIDIVDDELEKLDQ